MRKKMKKRNALLLSVLAIAGIASSITFPATGMNIPMPYIPYWSGTRLAHSKREYLKKMIRDGLKISKKMAEIMEKDIQNERISLDVFTYKVNMIKQWK